MLPPPPPPSCCLRLGRLCCRRLCCLPSRVQGLPWQSKASPACCARPHAQPPEPPAPCAALLLPPSFAPLPVRPPPPPPSCAVPRLWPLLPLLPWLLRPSVLPPLLPPCVPPQPLRAASCQPLRAASEPLSYAACRLASGAWAAVAAARWSTASEGRGREGRGQLWAGLLAPCIHANATHGLAWLMQANNLDTLIQQTQGSKAAYRTRSAWYLRQRNAPNCGSSSVLRPAPEAAPAAAA